MEVYQSFAQVYDELMDNVPYDTWCEYLCRILRSHQITDGLVLDLGCGTGQMTRRLQQRGYDMIGVDNSGEMLERAREYKDQGILYLQQDMREFELYGTVRAVVSVCDSMNYMLSSRDLLQVFSLVNNYLDPGGIFIFDMNTIHEYRDEIGDTSICENREHESFIWENFYDPESRINEYDVTFYIEEKNGLYRRYEEVHRQRGYETAEVRGLLEKAGMRCLAVYGDDAAGRPDDDTRRMYFVAQEHGKQMA